MRYLLPLLALLSLLLVATPAWAAPAYDAFSVTDTDNFDADETWTHTPSGTPAGVVVFISQTGQVTDQIDGVTYDGESMTEFTASPSCHDDAEDGCVYGYYLVTGVNSGAVTVSVDANCGPCAAVMEAWAVTFTAATANMEVRDNEAQEGITPPDPNSGNGPTLTNGSNNSVAAEGIWTGNGAVSQVDPYSGDSWVSRDEHLFSGSSSVGAMYTYPATTSDIECGFQNADDDYALLCISLSEPTGGGGPLTLEGIDLPGGVSKQ